MKIFESPFRSARSAAVLAGALAALVYANSLLNGFAYDDLNIIVDNPALHALSKLPAAIASPYWPGAFAKQLGLWRPLTTAYFGLQWVLFGGSPLPYHLVSLLGHVAVTALVVLLLAELMSVPVAFIGGLVFAVHPVHVEAVANVVGSAEVGSAFFFLLACLVHVRGPSKSRWPRALLIAFLYGVAFGIKEGAVTLPAVLFLLDAARRRIGFAELPGYLRERWRLYLSVVVVAAIMLFLRFQVLGSIAHPFGPLGADLLKHVPRIWTLAEVWSHYVSLWVFPLDLSSDYSPNVIPIALGWNGVAVAGLVLALAVLLMSLILWRRPEMRAGRETARIAAFGVVWFIITMSPVSNIAFISGVMLAERTFYLPSVGLVAATGWLLVRYWRARPRQAVGVTAACLVLLGVRTWTRTPTWKTNDSVFITMMRDHPESGRSQWVLGDLFLQEHRIHRALVAYGNAINILGVTYPLITQIGRKLMVLHDYRAAKLLFQQAWQQDPSISVAPANLAVIYSEEGDARETERFCEIARRLGRDDAVTYHLLAWAYAKEGRWTLAAQARRKAIARGQGDYWQQWESLAYLEWHRGDTASARTAFDSAAVKAKGRLALARIDSLKTALLGPSTGAKR